MTPFQIRRFQLVHATPEDVAWLQEQALARIADRLLPNGYLVIGTHERLPDHGAALTPLDHAPQIFRKSESAAI